MRVILADNNQVSLWALKTLLLETPEIEVVGDAQDTDSLLNQAADTSPELILVDMDLPGDAIEDLIANLHSFKPRPIVIVMSAKQENARYVLHAGADAFVSKSDNPDWLLATLLMYEKRLKKSHVPESNE
jgi:DNA-binding NarL/FixJ family response regulator